MTWAVWIVALAAVTTLMTLIRSSLSTAHVVLAYLVLVLGASARGGRTLGLSLSVIAFGCFNFFFLPPYHTFAVADSLDWLVLGAFLVTSAIAAQLLSQAQNQALEARRHAADVDRLAALGAEALNAGRAEDALTAVADVIRASLGVARCEVHLRVPGKPLLMAAMSGTVERPPDRPTEVAERALGLPSAQRLLDWVAEHGRPAAARDDGSLRFGDPGLEDVDDFLSSGSMQTLLLPLRVRMVTVGVLVLAHDRAIVLDAAAQRLLAALSYYAALGAERVRLSAEVEHTEALREADRLKDALLQSVSHDLRTPLTTIKALAHLIGAEGDERAITIEEEADRLNRFVADLLDLSRLAGGGLSVIPEINAAEDLLGVALQRVSGAAGSREIIVSLDVTEPLLIGRFDFAHSLRVLVNLIENALKYAPPAQPIEVSAHRSGESLEFLDVSVADRGPGVPPAERDRIFEPFYRPVGSAPDAGSAGLGLSIARRLAEAQGGRVLFEPRAGGGSVFTLRVPAAELSELSLESTVTAQSL